MREKFFCCESFFNQKDVGSLSSEPRYFLFVCTGIDLDGFKGFSRAPFSAFLVLLFFIVLGRFEDSGGIIGFAYRVKMGDSGLWDNRTLRGNVVGVGVPIVE